MAAASLRVEVGAGEPALLGAVTLSARAASSSISQDLMELEGARCQARESGGDEPLDRVDFVG